MFTSGAYWCSSQPNLVVLKSGPVAPLPDRQRLAEAGLFPAIANVPQTGAGFSPRVFTTVEQRLTARPFARCCSAVQESVRGSFGVLKATVVLGTVGLLNTEILIKGVGRRRTT